MTFGASTANLYPDLTERCLRQLLQLGIRQVEIFLNTESETDPAYLRDMLTQVQAVGGAITAVHPYLSAIEPYLLFSTYERRFRDGLAHYARIFEAAAALHAPYVVMHGAKEGALPMDDAIGRFAEVYDLGQTYGVTLLQENVVRYRSADNAYLRRMRELLGNKAGFVFDFKQCRRSGHTPAEVLDAMGDKVRHVHISDGNETRDCLPPGRGTDDLATPLRRLQQQAFDGVVMLELYRSDFDDSAELKASIEYLSHLL